MTMTNIPSRRMNVLHAVAVGAAVVGFLFILFWASEAAGVGPLPAPFVDLLTGGQGGAWAALGRGMPAAIAVGAVAGASIAIFANLFRFMDRR